MGFFSFRAPRISLGKGLFLNLGQRGPSLSTRLGKGMTVNTGARGTTFTATTRIAKGLSITTRVRNGRTTTRLNLGRLRFW